MKIIKDNKEDHLKLRTNYMAKPSLIIGLVLFTLNFSACKKSQVPENDNNPITERKDQINSNLDSIFQYAQQIYLWNEQLPSKTTFNPSRFFNAGANNEIAIYKDEIMAISKFAINPFNNNPFEYNALNLTKPKYSSIIEINASPSTDININTSDNDYGIAFVGTANNEVRLLYVDANSSAGLLKLHRGLKVIAVNGKTAKATPDYYSFISAALKEQSMTITIEELANGQPNSKTVQLSKRPYRKNPVLAYKIIKEGLKKIGYIAYNSFTYEEDSRKYLDPIFSMFSTAGISELVVDLRYNGGGYQSTAIYLANKIAPASTNGKLMFTEFYNKMMQDGKADLLKNQPLLDGGDQPIYIDGRIATLMDLDYSPAGNSFLFEQQLGPSIEVKKVSFIVSNKTASSSELLINVLKPYMELKIIGVSTDGATNVKTYGKPVGFFDIRIDRYKMYLAMYQDKNAHGEGDFFDGLPADLSTEDEVSVDFGEKNDPAISAILGISNTLASRKENSLATSSQLRSGSPSFNRLTPKTYLLPEPSVSGMIKTAKQFKLKTKNITDERQQ
ncbi:S41 family peptidase [Pedobacter gandavensis]|uniref:S41 family peptidase n=1 Tax=Pedobacter gandavensis TaxID=2679963 RepID=UPI002931E1EA|nr:S41 family peptidase [Pedobacter gandavensis]